MRVNEICVFFDTHLLYKTISGSQMCWDGTYVCDFSECTPNPPCWTGSLWIRSAARTFSPLHRSLLRLRSLAFSNRIYVSWTREALFLPVRLKFTSYRPVRSFRPLRNTQLPSLPPTAQSSQSHPPIAALGFWSVAHFYSANDSTVLLSRQFPALVCKSSLVFAFRI